MKVRLDKALVERGLVGSRERAQALILAGRVLVGEQKVEKPGTAVAEDVALRVLGEDMRYVSRGGLKLERALEYWAIALDGRGCVDVGLRRGDLRTACCSMGRRACWPWIRGMGRLRISCGWMSGSG